MKQPECTCCVGKHHFHGRTFCHPEYVRFSIGPYSSASGKRAVLKERLPNPPHHSWAPLGLIALTSEIRERGFIAQNSPALMLAQQTNNLAEWLDLEVTL